MKLYWRYKKDGKWTWRSAKTTTTGKYLFTKVPREEEE